MRTVLIGMLAALGQTTQPTAPSADARCGSYCLFVALQALGLGPGNFTDLERELGPPPRVGYSMAQIERVARRYQAHPLEIEAEVENLSSYKRPFACLAHTENQYVLIQDVDREAGIVHLIDPPHERKVPIETFKVQFSRKMLLLGRDEVALASERDWRKVALIALSSAFLLVLIIAVIRRATSGPSARTGAALLTPLLILQALIAGCDSKSALSGPRGATAASPGLRVERQFHDLGKVLASSPDEVVDATVMLFNDSSEPIRITELRKSCNCTTAQVDPPIIPAGGRSDLAARIKVGRKSGPDRVIVTVVSSNREIPDPEVTFGWEAVTSLALQPGQCDFGRIAPTRPSTMQRTLQVRGISLCPDCRVTAVGNDGSLAGVASLSPSRPIEGHESQKSEGRVSRVQDIGTLNVTVSASDESGDYRQGVDLTLMCGKSTRSQLFVPVEWSVRPPIEVIPSRLWLGRCRTDESIEKEVVVRSTTGIDLRVGGVTCEGQDLLQSVTFDGRGSQERAVRLVLRPRGGAGLHRGNLVIEVTGANSHRLVLPYSCLVE